MDDEADDNEDQQGTSRHDGLDDDDNQDDPPSGIGPSTRGARIAPSNPLRPQSKPPPPPAPEETNQKIGNYISHELAATSDAGLVLPSTNYKLAGTLLCLRSLLNNMMDSSTIHETVAAAVTKRKRVSHESTGLLQDMLQPFDIADEESPPFHLSHLSLSPSTSDQGSNPAGLLYIPHEETLQLSMDDIPFLIEPIENQIDTVHPLCPLKGSSNSIIEQLNPPILNPITSQHLIVHSPPPLSIDNSNATTSTLPHDGRPPTKRKGTPSYREAHIHSERQRRQDMASLFHTLRCLLPNNIGDDDRFKGDRCTLLKYVIEYVQQLDKKVQELASVRTQLLKVAHHNVVVKEEFERPIEDNQGIGKAHVVHMCDVSVRFWGHVDLFITLNCPKHHGIWPQLMALLQDTLQLDVQNVTLAATPFFCVHTIYAKVISLSLSLSLSHHNVPIIDAGCRQRGEDGVLQGATRSPSPICGSIQ
ncbi:hypothetical protein L7F22_056015 [Adiantum nelumboides]|nr:hypothetical protein [Adiantum nelumboides]